MSVPTSPPEPEYRRGRGGPSTDTAAFEALLARVGREGGEDASREAPAPERPVTEPVTTWTASVPAQGQPMTRREAREREAQAAREAEARAAAAPGTAVPPADGPSAATPALGAEAAVGAAAAAASAAPSVQPEQPHPDHDFHHWLHATHDSGAPRQGKPQKPKRRGRRAAIWLISTIVILGLLGGGAYFAWTTFQPQVQALIAKLHPSPTDWTGDGTGTVDVTIKEGDTGSSISTALATAGVTRTPDVFYQLLLHTSPEPVFQPGVYRLRQRMSAASALALLQNPTSRLAHTLLIREGDTEATALKNAATATGVPLAQLQAAAKNPAVYGLPSQAKTLEGFLYPATYTFDPGVTAQQVITTLVNRAKQQFSTLGISDAQLWNTVILASIVQKEAGPNPADLPLIAGVFHNRLAVGMPLQSDATVMYGTGKTGSVWTSDADRANASNPYNTYIHTGLTPGPIGNPGSAALSAAMHPQGDYLYFTAVNLKTGESAFAKTQAQQNANVAKLQAWCQQPGNASYCK